MTVVTQDTTPAAVSTVSTRVDWAQVPRVNLLPPEVLAARGFRRVQEGLAVAVVLTLAAAALLFWWASTGVARAQEGLDAEQAVTSTLQREQAKYAEVPLVLGRLDAAQTARQAAMSTDVAWHTVLYDLSVVTPTRVWLQSVNALVPMPTGAAPVAAAAGPLDTPGVGTVTVTGTAPTFQDVAEWLDAVDTVNGLDASILDTAVLDGDLQTPRSEAYVTFTTHITVTDAAFTHRYDRKAS